MSKSAQHSAIFVGAYFLTSFLNYGFGVALSWFFTPAEYGRLGVAQSLLLLVALAVGSGFSWSANQVLAARGLTDHSRVSVRTALLVNTILGGFIAIGLWFFYRMDVIPLGEDYFWIIPFVSITTLILAIRAVVNGAARGLFHFRQVALNLVIEVVTKSLVGILLVWLGLSVRGVMMAFAIGAGISLLHSLWIVRKANLWRGKVWFRMQAVLSSLPLFVGMVSIALMLNIDVLALKILSPLTSGDALTGFYQAAVILARTPVFLAQAVTLVLFSYASSQRVLDSHEPGMIVRELPDFKQALSIWGRLLLPGSLVLMLAPQTALGVFFPEVYQSSDIVLVIAAAGGLMLSLVTLINGLLQATGQQKSATLAVMLSTLAQVFGMVYLIPRYGAVGAAWSLLIASLFALILFMGLLKPSSRQYWAVARLCFLDQIVPLICMVIPLVLLPASSWFYYLAKLILSGLIYITTLFYFSRKTSPFAWSSTGAVRTVVQVFLGG